MALDSPVLAAAPEDPRFELEYPLIEPVDAPPVLSCFRILRAPPPELLDEPEDLAGDDLSEPPCELPSRLTVDVPEPCPAVRLTELVVPRPAPLPVTRPLEDESWRSIMRLPLIVWTEILLPDGRTFRLRFDRLIRDSPLRVAVSRTATRETLAARS